LVLGRADFIRAKGLDKYLDLHHCRAYSASMDIESLRIITLVSKHGSFAATARVLGVDPSSVSRTVSRVEDYLGVRLFQRSTRALSATEGGASYIAHIAPLLEEFDGARDALEHGSREPMGVLKMTASVSFAHTCFIPYLGEFLEKNPGIEVELVTTDVNLDLIAENIDLALRLAPAPSGDLISTKIISTRYAVCASPGYIASHSALNKPQDLQRHHCLCFALPNYRTNWRFRQGAGSPMDIEITGKVVISNALSIKQATLDGVGPALLPDWLIKNDLEHGHLINLFPQYDVAATSFDTAAWALYPSRSFLPNKVRVMIDFLRLKLR